MQGEDGFAFSRKSDSIGLNQTRRLSWLSMIYMARAETQGCAAFPGSIHRQRIGKVDLVCEIWQRRIRTGKRRVAE